MKKKKLIFVIASFAVLVCIILSLLLASNIVIARSYDSYIYNEIQKVPTRKVALLLGTSKYYNGLPNLYYNARIKAVAALYHLNKVSKILASGDNSTKDYDEPTDMKIDLVKLGVNEKDIYLDYAGFRTLDSIVRANKIFSLNEFIIVSQESHCERALFIAHNNNIQAIAYTAKDIQHADKFRLIIREYLARVKAGLDIWILNTSPKFSGAKTEII